MLTDRFSKDKEQPLAGVVLCCTSVLPEIRVRPLMNLRSRRTLTRVSCFSRPSLLQLLPRWVPPTSTT
jgi:hypothetical protein